VNEVDVLKMERSSSVSNSNHCFTKLHCMVTLDIHIVMF